MTKKFEKREHVRVQGYLTFDDYLKFEAKCEKSQKHISRVVRELVKNWIKRD